MNKTINNKYAQKRILSANAPVINAGVMIANFAWKNANKIKWIVGANSQAVVALTPLNSRLEDGSPIIPPIEGPKHKPKPTNTHNTVTTPGMKNDIGTSAKDVNSAKNLNTTIYSIDSWTGTQKGGNAIHRVTGSGVQTNNVGTTTGFNMGHDALRNFIDKQKKP